MKWKLWKSTWWSDNCTCCITLIASPLFHLTRFIYGYYRPKPDFKQFQHLLEFGFNFESWKLCYCVRIFPEMVSFEMTHNFDDCLENGELHFTPHKNKHLILTQFMELIFFTSKAVDFFSRGKSLYENSMSSVLNSEHVLKKKEKHASSRKVNF